MTRFVQKSKSHDDGGESHVATGTARARIAKHGGRHAQGRSPSTSPHEAGGSGEEGEGHPEDWRGWGRVIPLYSQTFLEDTSHIAACARDTFQTCLALTTSVSSIGEEGGKLLLGGFDAAAREGRTGMKSEGGGDVVVVDSSGGMMWSSRILRSVIGGECG